MPRPPECSGAGSLTRAVLPSLYRSLPDDLAALHVERHDDDVAVVSNMGAPLVSQERLVDSRMIARPVEVMQDYIGRLLPRRDGGGGRRRQRHPGADGGGTRPWWRSPAAPLQASSARWRTAGSPLRSNPERWDGGGGRACEPRCRHGPQRTLGRGGRQAPVLGGRPGDRVPSARWRRGGRACEPRCRHGPQRKPPPWPL
jgi:hypothetical protein